MAKKKRSALKRIRQTERRTTIKTVARSAARSAVKTARAAIEKGGEAVQGAVAEAASMLDRAAKRGAIHKNAARRKRSRIAKRAVKSTKAKSS
jgi:small subunit ribosomal protein S20